MPQGQVLRYKHVPKDGYDIYEAENHNSGWHDVHFTLTAAEDLTAETWTWSHVTFVYGTNKIHVYTKLSGHKRIFKTLGGGEPNADVLRLAETVCDDMMFLGVITKSTEYKITGVLEQKVRDYNAWLAERAAEARRAESAALAQSLQARMAEDRAKGMAWGKKR